MISKPLVSHFINICPLRKHNKSIQVENTMYVMYFTKNIFVYVGQKYLFFSNNEIKRENIYQIINFSGKKSGFEIYSLGSL